MDISNNSCNDGNQQGKFQEPRLNQGQPLDMFQLMQTLIGVVQQQATTGDNLLEWWSSTKVNKVEWLNLRDSPPTFEGAIEPMEVEKWMIVKEKVFIVLKCSKGEKVGYATYMLQGN